MTTGWIKLHRKILDSAVNSLPTNQKWVMITILLMANHEEKGWLWEGKDFKCLPGQMVTSLESISKASGESIQTVRTALKNLEKLGFLTNKSTKTGRLITIEKWGFYQLDEAKPNKEVNKQSTNNQQRANKELTPNKNVRMKECKNERSIDTSTAEIFQHYQKCGFQINGYTAQDLDDLINDFGAEWCKAAMTRAKERGKLSMAYLKGILNSWRTSGGMDSGKTAEQEAEEKKAEKAEARSAQDKRKEEWLEYRKGGHDVDFFEYARIKKWI